MTSYSRLGWEFYDKYRIHLRLSDSIVLVTPGKNWVNICNAEAVTEIFQLRNDLYRPSEMLAMLDIFGPNVSTMRQALFL